MVSTRLLLGPEQIQIEKLLLLHHKSPLGIRDSETLAIALKKCHRCVVLEHGDQYIASGRSISDGKYTFILELVVDAPYKKQGYGTRILNELLKGEEKNYVHLTSTWEAEIFYQKAGFKRHKTGYARYPKSSEYLFED